MIKLTDILSELSAIAKYYKNNPDKLIAFDGESSLSPNDQEIVDYIIASGEVSTSDTKSDVIYNLEKKLRSDYANRIKSPSVSEIISTTSRISRNVFKSKGNSLSSVLGSWQKIVDEVKESYSYSKSFKENASEIDELLNDEELKEYIRLSILMSYRFEMAVKKFATKSGMRLDAFIEAVSEIRRLQSKSYQKMSVAHKKVIKALTVDKNNLPETIWRGFFFDGAKIKDKASFLRKWAEGNTPNVAFTKETSWSKSRQTAIRFMTNQDRVKDAENGFHVLLRYDNPKYEDIAADLSNFTLSRFYNQKEVMLNTSAKGYTVEKLIPYEKWDKDKESEYGKFTSANSDEHGAGAWGLRKVELIGDIFRAHKAKLKPSEKVEVVNLINTKLSDVNRKYTGNFSDYLLNVAKDAKFPLVSFTIRELDLGYAIGKMVGAKWFGQATVENLEFSEDTSKITYKLPSDGETLKTILLPINNQLTQESPDMKVLLPEDFEIKITVIQAHASFYRFEFKIKVDDTVYYTGPSKSKYSKEAANSISTFLIPRINELLKTKLKSEMKEIGVTVTVIE